MWLCKSIQLYEMNSFDFNIQYTDVENDKLPINTVNFMITSKLDIMIRMNKKVSLGLKLD